MRPQPYWGGGENSGNALEASNALNDRAWGIPAVLSREIPGNALRAFPGVFPEFFRNFFRKVPAVLGVWPNKEHPETQHNRKRRKLTGPKIRVFGLHFRVLFVPPLYRRAPKHTRKRKHTRNCRFGERSTTRIFRCVVFSGALGRLPTQRARASKNFILARTHEKKPSPHARNFHSRLKFSFSV